MLGTAWSRGLFKHLREFALFLAKAQDTGVIKPLAEAWRTTATENTLHLEVRVLSILACFPHHHCVVIPVWR